MLLPQKLKEIRLNSGLPQRKIAAALDIDTATYCKIEKGTLKIQRKQLSKFAELLNIDANDLLVVWLSDQVTAIVEPEEQIAKRALDLTYNSVNATKSKV